MCMCVHVRVRVCAYTHMRACVCACACMCGRGNLYQRDQCGGVKCPPEKPLYDYTDKKCHNTYSTEPPRLLMYISCISSYTEVPQHVLDSASKVYCCSIDFCRPIDPLIDHRLIRPSGRLPVRLSVHSSIDPSIHQTIETMMHPSINPSKHRLINRSSDRFVDQSSHPSSNRSIHPNTHRSIDPVIYRSIHPSTYPPTCPSTRLPIHPSIDSSTLHRGTHRLVS